MYHSNVIITNQKAIEKVYYLEDEVGLSTYDLTLISYDKINKKRKASMKENTKSTFLI